MSAAYDVYDSCEAEKTASFSDFDADAIFVNYDVGSGPITGTGIDAYARNKSRATSALPRFALSELASKFIATIQQRSPLTELVTRLREFRALPPNWDSYGAEPICQEATSVAFELLSKLNERQCAAESVGIVFTASVLPQAVVPLNDGGVQLEWHTKDIDAELEISPSRVLNLIVFCVIDGQRAVVVAEEISSDEAVDQVLELFLANS